MYKIIRLMAYFILNIVDGSYTKVIRFNWPTILRFSLDIFFHYYKVKIFFNEKTYIKICSLYKKSFYGTYKELIYYLNINLTNNEWHFK